jgi:hypothetical protein
VSDTIAPVITCLPDITVSCAADVPLPELDSIEVTDNCLTLVNITVAVDDTTSFSGTNNFILLRVYTAEDACGNSASCTQTITVSDTTAPVITCLADITVACAADVPLPELDSIVAIDLCDSLVTVTVAVDDTTDIVCGNSYTLLRVYTAVDASGNSASCTQTITVADTLAPVIVCLPDITVACAADVPLPELDSIVATDLCDSLVTVSVAEDDTTDFVCANGYTLLRVYTAVDACGNSASCTQSITVSDTLAPVISVCLEDITVSCAADIPLPQLDSIVASDLCDSLVTITVAADDTTSFDCANTYTLLRVYTASDACGNSVSCTQAITVSDTTAPVITCLADLTVACAADVPLPDIEAIVAIDLCDSTLVTVTVAVDDTTDFVCANSYTLLRVYTAADACGNSASCTQTITVSDTIAPVITCLPDITVECSADIPPVNIDSIEVTDLCDSLFTITVTVDDTTDFTCANQYTITRIITAVDSCGNSATCSQTIVVNDTIAPVLTCPADISVLCGSVPDPDTLDVEVSDNCDSLVTVTFVEDIPSGETCPFEIERIYQATDACGNSATCVQIIFVLDTAALPEDINIEVPDSLIVQCYGQDSTWDVPELDIHDITIEGGCSIPVITHTDTITASENCEEDGYIAIYERIYTAADSCGNSDSDTLILVLVDTIPPVIHGVPANVTVNADSIPPPPALVYATDECLCACVMLMEETQQDTGCLHNSVIIRTWSSKDQCGNRTEAIQRITVRDVEGPEFTLELPGMHIENRDTLYFNCETGGIPDEVINLNVHSIDFGDNSLPSTIDFRMDSTHNRNCEFYGFLEERIYIWEATDACGNTAEFRFTVWLNDHQSPVINDVPDTTCIADPLLDLVEAEDNCSPVALRFWDTQIDNPCGEGLAFLRTYEAEDGCGNLAVDTAILIPDDDQGPLLYFINPQLVEMLQGDTVEVECNNINGTYTAYGPRDIGLSDICPTGVDISFSEQLISTGNCENDRTVATVRLTWLATDQCGNASTISLVGIVKDHTPPRAVNFAQEVSVGCTEDIRDIVTTDNCGSVTIHNQDVIHPGPCPYKYDIRRQITVTDQCGNSATYLQLIHVGDDNGPVVRGVEEEICDDLSMPLVTAFDSCAGVQVAVTMAQDTLDDTCLDGLVIRRIWTAIDLCGDTTSVTQLIILGDTVAPEIIIPVNSIIQNILSVDTIPVYYLSQTGFMNELNELDEFSVTIQDNCQLDLVPVFQEIITPSPNPMQDGFTERRFYSWVVTDACGNSAEVEFFVRIVDDMPPVVGLPGDTVIYCSPLPPPVSMTPEDTSEVFTVTFTEVITNGQQPGEFNVVRTWTFTDMSGNVSTIVQHIRWIPDTFLECDIIPPHEPVTCNSHNVLIESDVTGGVGPYTYWWVVVGDECFIQSGQSTPEISIYVGWAPVRVILYVTDVYGCTTSCETTIYCQAGDTDLAAPNPNGTDADESNDALTIWPNPTDGAVDIRLNFSEKYIYQVSVVNLLGETVLTKDVESIPGLNELHLDLSHLSEGTYFIKIESPEFQSLRKIMLLNDK